MTSAGETSALFPFASFTEAKSSTLAELTGHIAALNQRDLGGALRGLEVYLHVSRPGLRDSFLALQALEPRRGW